MKVRSKNDKWLIMRGRNTERLEKLEKDIRDELDSTSIEGMGVYSAILFAITCFIVTIGVECVLEIAGDMLCR